MGAVNWQGFEAWRLENEAVRVVIVPQLGAKIVSLVDREADYEWLAPPTRPLRQPTYGEAFTQYDLSGWDEMFPTINACAVPGAVGGQLPDHGEVWALPWSVLASAADTLSTRVAGTQSGYRYTLSRTASLEGPTLRLDYVLENRTDRELPFLWAAHPLFNGDDDTRIQLDAAVKRVVNVAAHPAMGAPGREVDYPRAALLTGAEQPLDRVRDAAVKDYRKVYTLPDQPMSAAGLLKESTGRALRMTWDAAIAPYLGIWVDEGRYTRTTTVALEPASGYYDSLEAAVANDRVATVGAGATVTWELAVTLGAI